MATPERRIFERGLQRVIDLDRKAHARSPVAMTRRVEAAIDVGQLPTRETVNLRISQADVDAGRADPEDLGKFWFVPGYSIPGGPDIVRPE